MGKDMIHSSMDIQPNIESHLWTNICITQNARVLAEKAHQHNRSTDEASEALRQKQ
jgi:hypothetical protein